MHFEWILTPCVILWVILGAGGRGCISNCSRKPKWHLSDPKRTRACMVNVQCAWLYVHANFQDATMPFTTKLRWRRYRTFWPTLVTLFSQISVCKLDTYMQFLARTIVVSSLRNPTTLLTGFVSLSAHVSIEHLHPKIQKIQLSKLYFKNLSPKALNSNEQIKPDFETRNHFLRD